MTTPADQIQSTLDRYNAAWKANDAAAVAAFFTEDGSIINPFGERADGRAAVAAMYARFFQGMLKGTTHTFRVGKVRTVEKDYALVDGDEAIVGADGNPIMALHLAALMRREGEAWRFVDARPYAFAAVPV